LDTLWPRLQYAAQRLKQVDPNGRHKTYVILATPPPPDLLSSVPSLDVLQCDWYVFQDTTDKNLKEQQDAFEALRVRFDSTAVRLKGKNAEWHGAQLICLNIIPEAPVSEFETICGQEPGGIMTAVTLGQPVDRTAPLPVIPGTVQFQITGDFLVLDSWETTWTVK